MVKELCEIRVLQCYCKMRRSATKFKKTDPNDIQTLHPYCGTGCRLLI